MSDSNSEKKSEESNERRNNSEEEKGFENENEPGDYFSSINYYNYYYSLNPPDPLLPKPLYKPKKLN